MSQKNCNSSASSILDYSKDAEDDEADQEDIDQSKVDIALSRVADQPTDLISWTEQKQCNWFN